jgi:CIC family chloride channel protein
MDDKTLIGKFLVWRARNINDRYFIIILSAIIGFLAGVAAYLLKTTVFFIQDNLTEWFKKSEQNYLFVIYPVTGILLTVLFLKYVVRDETRHGIPRILYVISKLGGRMKQHKIFSSLVGS